MVLPLEQEQGRMRREAVRRWWRWAKWRRVEGAFGGNEAEADWGRPFIPRGWLGSGT